MRTKRVILGSILGFVIILAAMFFIKVGWVITGEKNIDKKEWDFVSMWRQAKIAADSSLLQVIEVCTSSIWIKVV